MSDVNRKAITSNRTKRNYHYSLNDKLGSGSFAEVYKGIIEDTGEEIAIKVINKSIIQKYGPEIRSAIGNEVNVLQKISNEIKTPYIVKIYECFETNNNIYIILEFCNDGTLADILKTSKTLPEKESLIIIYQIILALVAMDTKGIAHRDIKPENIFINKGVYKIGDFGFAAQKTLFQTTLGTYPYMAPEIFQNKEYSNKVDVWAVGVMLHEMLFGELYFIGNSHMEVANNVQKKNYQLKQPCHLSPETQKLLISCLEKDPNARISASELKNHSAFAQVRNLSVFKALTQSQKPAKLPDEAAEVRTLLENHWKSVEFLENLAERLRFSNKTEEFARFYLFDMALKQAVSLKSFLLGENRGVLSGLNESKRKSFVNSPYYEDFCKKFQGNFARASGKHGEFLNEFANQLQSKFPKEKDYLLLLVNNAINIDIEGLFAEELSCLKLKIIREGEDFRRNNDKFHAQEKYLLAYELTLAINLKRLLYEQFDFLSYEETSRQNLKIEDLMKQI